VRTIGFCAAVQKWLSTREVVLFVDVDVRIVVVLRDLRHQSSQLQVHKKYYHS
jgi:hypothetical protein